MAKTNKRTKKILNDNPEPSETEVRAALSGNLCRCTGYQGVVAAVLQALGRDDVASPAVTA